MAEGGAEAVLERSRLFEKGGELLQAYDLLVEGLTLWPDSIEIKHRAVLMLARAGATENARREFLRLGLEQVTDSEEVLALGGRLLKDLSMAASGARRQNLARDSAAKYAQAYAIRQGYYPGINTATMTLLAGDPAQAGALAERVFLDLDRRTAPSGAEAYYVKATMAEAQLLTHRFQEADTTLAEAIACDPRDYAAHASTLRQFGLISRFLGHDPWWLDRHRPPPALHYCGHMFGAPLPKHEDIASRLAGEVQGAIQKIRPGAVFGALAAGSDILVAEAALASGAELHVVLPMREQDFLEQSVSPYGASWCERFHACLRQASTSRFATHEPFLGDNSIFAYSSEIAMGLAVRHGDHNQTRAEQLALWDGASSAGIAGTGADVTRWRATGRGQTVIAFPPALRQPSAPAAKPAALGDRTLKAMIFGDVRGFSKLEEGQIRPFVEQVLAPLAAALRALSVPPEQVETWGDGLYVVFSDAASAAVGALALLRRFAEIDLAAVGLPPHLALRLGGHAGPVTSLADPFKGTANFYGTQVTIAARIEPVAMPGSFYVSEPFAALLGLSAAGRYRTDYIGQMELAKKAGNMRLFAVSEM